MFIEAPPRDRKLRSSGMFIGSSGMVPKLPGNGISPRLRSRYPGNLRQQLRYVLRYLLHGAEPASPFVTAGKQARVRPHEVGAA